MSCFPMSPLCLSHLSSRNRKSSPPAFFPVHPFLQVLSLELKMLTASWCLLSSPLSQIDTPASRAFHQRVLLLSSFPDLMEGAAFRCASSLRIGNLASAWGRNCAPHDLQGFIPPHNVLLLSWVVMRIKELKLSQMHFALACRRTLMEYYFDQIGCKMLLLVNNTAGQGLLCLLFSLPFAKGDQ